MFFRKSTLVNQIKKPLAEKNGFFIEGKFDVSARPDKVLASALESFFAGINTSNAGENTYSMRWRINDAIGSGVSCLFDVIPSLQKFMTNSTEIDRTEERTVGCNVMGQRLKYIFCKLIKAIPCRSQPLVLVLDDLQVSIFFVVLVKFFGFKYAVTYNVSFLVGRQVYVWCDKDAHGRP